MTIDILIFVKLQINDLCKFELCCWSAFRKFGYDTFQVKFHNIPEIAYHELPN